MSVLLRQAHGSEGVSDDLELGELHNFPASERQDVSDSGHHVRSAAPARTAHLRHGENSVSEVDELLRHRPVFLEYLRQLRKKLLLPGLPVMVGTRLVEEHVGGIPFQIGIRGAESTRPRDITASRGSAVSGPGAMGEVPC